MRNDKNPSVGEKFGLVKVNPFATWSDDDVANDLTAHDLARHPLWVEGCASNGCAGVTCEAAGTG